MLDKKVLDVMLNIQKVLSPVLEKAKQIKTTSISDLSDNYLQKTNLTFIHKEKQTEYILLDVVNSKSTDQEKFPTMVVYYDKQLQTKWCRSLIEFDQKFELKV